VLWYRERVELICDLLLWSLRGVVNTRFVRVITRIWTN
jgi:hypothetical protein